MSSMSVGKKLFLGVGVSFAFTLALGCTGLIALSNVAGRFHAVSGPTVDKYRLAYQINSDVRELRSYERGVLVRASVHDLQTAERYMQNYAQTADQIDASSDKLLIMVHRPDAIQDLKQLRELTANVREVDRSMFEAVKANDLDRATSIDVAKSLPAVAATIKVADDLVKIQDDVLESDRKVADSAISFDRWTMGLMMVPCFLVGGILVMVVFGVNRVLRERIAELGGAVVEVTAAAEQIALSSQSLAQGASEQAATIEETSSAATEINSMAQRNTENSRTTKQLVEQSQVRFEETDQSLTEMVDAMGGIISSSEKISKIIKVIEEIAFQTNILALNAAVEAARAGDAGMGFAVVADEVRSLSHRSAKAAKDTSDLIEESIQRSHDGKEKVDRVAESIRAVTAESAKVRVLIDEINLGSVEQSRGVDQISRSIHEMEKVTQSAAAGAEESAATAEELRTQARSLEEITSRMQLLVGGANPQAEVAYRAPLRIQRPAHAH